MRIARIGLVCAAVFGLYVATAQASTLSIVGGTAGVTPSGAPNDVLAPLGLVSPLKGYYGASIASTGPGSVTYEYFGFEAVAINKFVASASSFITIGGKVVTSSTSPLGNISELMNFAGPLSFSFLTSIGSGHVANGSNNLSGSGAPNFFASVAGNSASRDGSSIWLFLDDGGGGPDSDYDDMAVRVSFTPAVVPLPASGVLLAAVLLLVGIVGWGPSRFRGALRSLPA